ncbi:HalOD1 output domain-containing protein [Haloarcula marina]|uniref:HalOD1 output domain-containing protein n=1 Tax=Haloarcula marina TaxID=2961574 RepID=UPI0020B74FCF|nr:HalOD1 output domain-containing protein [Halomicroarcula marina]
MNERTNDDDFETVYEPTATNTICEHLVSFVGRISERDVIDLPPLYEAVDTDALEALYATAPDQWPTVVFEYAAFEVTVGQNGDISLQESAASD